MGLTIQKDVVMKVVQITQTRQGSGAQNPQLSTSDVRVQNATVAPGPVMVM